MNPKPKTEPPRYTNRGAWTSVNMRRSVVAELKEAAQAEQRSTASLLESAVVRMLAARAARSA